MARAGFSRTLSCRHGSGIHMGPRTPPWASVGPQASARTRLRKAFSGRNPHTAAGAQLPYPHQHWDLWCRGKPGLRGRRAPCRSRSSPPRPRACHPRGTASRSPSEEEEAEEEAPPPWRARRPGGLGRTHGGSLACAGPAGRRPPCAPALGALPSAALSLHLGARGGRAVAEPGPHQDPLVRQHGQRAGASGRRRHRAPCGAPGPRRGHASGHRAQVRSYGEQGAPPRPGPVAPGRGRGWERRVGSRPCVSASPRRIPARAAATATSV